MFYFSLTDDSEKIVKKYGGDLSSPVVLKAPTGEVWRVGFTRSDDGNVCFQNGLKEFMKYYSIAYGHFLVFRYDGYSIFTVSIFDPSGTEINYPYTLHNTEKGLSDSDGEFYEHDDEYSESEDDEYSDVLEKISAFTLQTRKIEMINSEDKAEKSSKFCQSSSSRQALRGRQNLNAFLLSGSFIICRKRNQIFIFKQAFNLFDYDNSIFMVTMDASYVVPEFHENVHVAADFERICFDKKPDHITIRIPDGRAFTVKYHGDFFKGWKQFVLDDQTRSGEACLFELCEPYKPLLRLTVPPNFFEKWVKLSRGQDARLERSGACWNVKLVFGLEHTDIVEDLCVFELVKKEPLFRVSVFKCQS
ncbi:uncharacterized protein [Rutidosis leptorrhynchoides]|uniref:uncharacterized protein n=1 Tax=Rutidosis leptorrhynchoides TaxID=125765 RepID=UPI003A9A1D8B